MIQRKLTLVLNKYPLVIKIVQAIHELGGRALLVGGSPRDLVIGRIIKDLDIEIHGLTLEMVEHLLQEYGSVSTVGKSFGVLRIHGLDVDWSLPRTDSVGRKPQVVIDPDLPLRAAFMRRDLTMNAMGIDLITYELIDPFDGLTDIHNKILRVPDEHLFKEDPLRFYRVMQFVGRFNMRPDEQLQRLCASMDISTVSVERIEQEFEKLFFRSEQPSLGIRWLQECGRLSDILPGIAALCGVVQEPRWHPEGDVFEHSMQALDASKNGKYDNGHDQLICMYAALCHDIGKATTTVYTNGVWRSLGHEHAGALLVPQLLRRITRKKAVIAAVTLLVKYHMVPWQLIDSNAGNASYKRLAGKLGPGVTLAMLAAVCLADKQGRNAESYEPLKIIFPEIILFLKRSRDAQVLTQVEPPILHGRDLLDVVPGGPKLGNLLKAAYNIQIDEGVTDKDELKKRVLSILDNESST